MAGIVLMVSLLAFSGCTTQKTDANTAANNRPFQPNGRYNRTSNLTEEQRQAIMSQLRQAALDACAGKGEGEECTLQSPMGERTGNCTITGNETLCNAGFTGRQPPGNRQP